MSIKDKKIRLINKASRSFLKLSLILMLASSVALYFYVSFVLQEEVDEELYSTAARVESALLNDSLTYSFPPIVEIQRIDTLGAEILKDTILYDPWEDDLEDFRELAQYRNINGTNYKITVRKFTLDSR